MKTKEQEAISAIVDILDDIIYEIEKKEPTDDLKYLKNQVYAMWKAYEKVDENA